MDIIFDKLSKIFNKNGYRLYMIGGTSRDYLLSRNIDDYDFVSDATPSEIAKFLKVDSTFAKYGTVKYFLDDKKIDLVTLRKEGDYKDSRHPSEIIFINDINVDYLRRDFTINAIYIDENYKVIDPSKHGVEDLNNKVLLFIGNPLDRVKEDPIRILRGERFALEYGLKIPNDVKKIFTENKYLLELLNKDKINEEERKLDKVKRGLKNERNKL